MNEEKELLVRITHIGMFLHAFVYYEDQPDMELDNESIKYLYAWKKNKIDSYIDGSNFYEKEVIPTFKNTILAEEGYVYEVKIIE